MTELHLPSASFSRRGFLGLAGGAAALAALTACNVSGGASTGGTGSGGGGTLKFWDMPWGAPAYSDEAKALTAAYQPSGTNLAADYQIIQWNNFTQTFSSAIASNTGPAVSTGGGFQAFQFAADGSIAYADDLLETFKKEGIYNDYLPGLVDTFKTANGYVAVPSQLDMRVWWYRKSIFDEVGVSLPTTWDEYFDVGKKLAAKGYYAFGVGSGAGNAIGPHTMIVMMINNGGGLFNANNELDCVNERNIEAIEFVLELAKEGIIDPASVSYTSDNVLTQWKDKKFVMGIHNPGLNDDIGDTEDDVLVAKPMAAPHGDMGTLQFVNNQMMYTNTPSQESSEAFMLYWFQNYQALWQKRVLPALPVLKSIAALPEFAENAQKTAILQDWQPIAKTYAAQGDTVTDLVPAIDAGQALAEFTQSVLGGASGAKESLEKLQKDIESL